MKRETRKIGKEPKKITLTLSKKNLLIRAIIAGTCLFLGIAFILNSCSKLFNQSTYLSITYPTFKNNNDEEITLFDNEVEIKYYYDVDIENEKKGVVLEKIDDILEDITMLHKLCDYNDLYLENDDYLHNIKYINDNPNKWIKVDTRLYDLLKEAVELKKNTNGKYSPFSGKLYEKWDELFYEYDLYGANDETIKSKDPLYNSHQNKIINSIVSSINNSTTFLEFDDNNQVKYNCVSSDKDNLKLDLGLLESAYYLDVLKSMFIENKLTSGIITNNSGMIVTLGQNLENGYWQTNSVSMQTLYNVELSTILDYSFFYNGELSTMTFNPLLNINCHANSSSRYYIFDDGNDVIIRSMIINSNTGYSNGNIHSSLTFSTKDKLVSQLKDNYNLFFGENNYEYLKNFSERKDYGSIIVFNNGHNNIEYNGQTTLMYSTLVENYFNENNYPYVKVSSVVKEKIVAKKGD